MVVVSSFWYVFLPHSYTLRLIGLQLDSSQFSINLKQAPSSKDLELAKHDLNLINM